MLILISSGEMEEELAAGNQDIALDIAKISGKTNKDQSPWQTAEAIVKGMLQHSRSSSGQRELININRLADEYIRLAFHGHRLRTNHSQPRSIPSLMPPLTSLT